ncbi:uncharacterized protein LOC114260943 [Camellia sinensis]|uniref:uncharacterized protein LOC114260943 n=1 Tax=Camellia sinensis TaxID=4442 RepID=UPI0010356F4F|nr:uncharacterized protein LOC114260943 [Camellia sinensis]
MDQSAMFNRDEIKEFAKEYGIQILKSSPYFAQANGNSKKNNIRTTHYELVYSHDAVLPLEVTVLSSRVTLYYDIPVDEYAEAMMMEVQDLEERRVMAYNHLLAKKRNVERTYNKRVKTKVFSERKFSIVWKIILPLGSKDPNLGKWSPNWEGLFKIYKVLKGGAYHLASIEGVPYRRVINGKYLKKHYPTMWASIKHG